MVASRLVRDLMWNRPVKRRRFPKTLYKKVRVSGEKGLVKGYSYYPSDEVKQWVLNQLSLAFKRHLILPMPKIQHGDSCLYHSVIDGFEACLRLAQWKVDPHEDIPRLSVQQSLDVMLPYRDSDTVYNFLDYQYVDATGLTRDQIGVTSAANYPYRPDSDPDPTLVPVPREVMHWDRYKLEDLLVIEGKDYDGRNESQINDLIKRYIEDGPFIAWYDMYSSHNPHIVLKRKGTKLVTLDEDGVEEGKVHAVIITGFRKWRSRRTNEFRGFWEFRNHGGLGWGENGFGKIAFDAIKGVEIMTPSLR